MRYARLGLPLTRESGYNFDKLKSYFTNVGKTCDTKPLHRRYSVIEKHPDTSQSVLEQLSRSAVILNERFRPNKQRLSSISTNEKRKIQAQPKILNHKRYQLTRLAQTKLSPTLAVSGNVPAAAVPRVGMILKKGVGTAVPHPSRAVSAPVPPRKEQ